jgi:hypothetical protein
MLADKAMLKQHTTWKDFNVFTVRSRVDGLSGEVVRKTNRRFITITPIVDDYDPENRPCKGP